jgi:hypothetical protein
MTETDQVSETLLFSSSLEYRTLSKVQKSSILSNPVYFNFILAGIAELRQTLSDFPKYVTELTERFKWFYRASYMILTARIYVLIFSIWAVPVTVAYKPLWHADCGIPTRKRTLCAGTWKNRIVE